MQRTANRLARHRFTGLVLVLTIVLSGPVLVSAQLETNPDDSATAEAAAPQITTEDVDTLRARLAGAEGAALSDELKARVGALLQQATDDLGAADKLQKDTEEFRRKKENLAKIRDELAASISGIALESEETPDPEASLTTLETELIDRQQQLADAQSKLDTWLADWQTRPLRREALRTSLFAQPEQLATVREELQTPPSANDPPLVNDAVRAAQLARFLRLQRIPEACKAELSYYDAQDTLDTPRLRRQQFELQLARRKKVVTAWDNAVQAKRKDAIARRIDSAESSAESADSPVKRLFDENAKLARDERTARSDEADVLDRHAKASEQIDALAKRFQNLKNRELKAAGSTALGIRLRQERERLANPETLRSSAASQLQMLENVRLTELDRTEDLEGLSDVESVVDAFIADNRPPLKVSESDYRREVGSAYLQRQEFLTELVDAYEDHAEALNDLVQKQEELAALTEEVQNFIDERVLWIRSHRTISPSGVLGEGSVLPWLARGEWWQEPLRVLRADAWSSPAWYLVFFCLVTLLQLRRRTHRRLLDEMAVRMQSRSNHEITPTLQALGITLILCLLWPGVVAFFAFRLAASPESTVFTRNLSHNLYAVAAIMAVFEFIRHLARVDGLADAHFEWGERPRRQLQSWVRWFALCGLPVLLAIAVLGARESDAGGSFLERIGFIYLLLLLAWALRDLMHPHTGLLVEWTAGHPGSWVDRLRPLWSRIIQFTPVVLAGLTFYGHYYTAQRLSEKLILTLVLLLATTVLRGLFIRWLMLRHRRLAIEQARARRAALAESAPASDESVARVLEATDHKADLSASSEQSRRLMNTSCLVVLAAAVWFVWADVLPALNRINSAPVWPNGTHPATLASAESATDTPETTLPLPSTGDGSLAVPVGIDRLTWGDLIRALVVLILTITAARNVPGLLELMILEKLPLDASVRYAVQAFARYGIILLGMVLVSNFLGLEWSKVQWLAAALTFGLAFGLQEIFANFVSGLIILSEQPVRVGDVVTIDEVSGVVSRVRMRSTTITDWDRKEYIVPNKEFITGKLLNWTLSDAITRVVIQVGVSYSADPKHVSRVILEIAESHDNVLREPHPSVTFDAFGDSALNFTLRAYLPSVERRLLTINDIHTQICVRFREEGIEIPFPQRDLNLRNLPTHVSKAIEDWGESAA